MKKLFLIICSLMPSYLICGPYVCANAYSLKDGSLALDWENETVSTPGFNPSSLCKVVSNNKPCCGIPPTPTYDTNKWYVSTTDNEYNKLVVNYNNFMKHMKNFTGLPNCVDKGDCIGASTGAPPLADS